MGFVYRSVLMYPFSSLDTLTSKKFTVVWLMSAVNLIVSWKEFKASKIQSTLVISNSKGLYETLRDIRSSTYQIYRTEEKQLIEQPPLTE